MGGGIMKKMLVGLLIIGLATGLIATLAAAHGEDEFNRAEQLIKQKVSCENATDEQLELIGDYYMEQIHPGELHERMDTMMGGEGSAQLKNVHISLARSFYCGEQDSMRWGMMNMMMGRSLNGIMSGIQNNTGGETMMNGYGMMGWGSGYWNIFTFLYLILVIGLIILVYLWIIKMLQENKKKR